MCIRDRGIEAQTLANAYLAVDSNLEIVPVINKIDLPSADIEGVRAEIEDVIGIPSEDCPAVSAKSGLNINQVLEKIVSDIPAPTGDPDLPLKALIFDSYYDSYLGVVVYVRISVSYTHLLWDRSRNECRMLRSNRNILTECLDYFLLHVLQDRRFQRDGFLYPRKSHAPFS